MKIKKTSRKKEKFKKRLIPIVLLTFIAIGIIYQQLSIQWDASKLGRVGRLVDVNGVNMHLYDNGESAYPLVFTANIGSNTPYVDLYPIHSALLENNRVLVYDRPGYGWSDYTSASRNIDTIVEEIHTLLHSDDVPGDEDTYFPPFIYVAQGMGALEAIRYAQLYPEDVAGIVFIEGTSPSFLADYNNIMIIESFLTNAMRHIGTLRLTSHTSLVEHILNDNEELPDELRTLNRGIALEKTWNRNVISEKLSVVDNAKIVLASLEEANLGDLPIRVITSESNIYSNWKRTQRSLLNLSSDTSQVFIEGSTEQIQSSDVPAILEVITSLIDHLHELYDHY